MLHATRNNIARSEGRGGASEARRVNPGNLPCPGVAWLRCARVAVLLVLAVLPLSGCHIADGTYAARRACAETHLTTMADRASTPFAIVGDAFYVKPEVALHRAQYQECIAKIDMGQP